MWSERTYGEDTGIFVLAQVIGNKRGSTTSSDKAAEMADSGLQEFQVKVEVFDLQHPRISTSTPKLPPPSAILRSGRSILAEFSDNNRASSTSWESALNLSPGQAVEAQVIHRSSSLFRGDSVFGSIPLSVDTKPTQETRHFTSKTGKSMGSARVSLSPSASGSSATNAVTPGAPMPPSLDKDNAGTEGILYKN